MHKFEHDVTEIPFDNNETIIIAADNNGAIGMKALDEVEVNYQTVSYYAFRVAYMECIAAGGEPFAIIMHSFNDESVWAELILGINQGLKEVDLENIPITGSTETNFKLDQSALGLVVLGKKKVEKREFLSSQSAEMAIIGKPLVGQEVIDDQMSVAPLSLYKEISKMPDISLMRPISSKGIKHEVERQINQTITYPTELDIQKSSGPGTSFLVVYDAKINNAIKNTAGRHIQMVETLT